MNGQETESEEKLIMADHQMNAFLEKAKKPIVWTRLPFGIRIEDLHPSYYEEVIDLIKRHYVPDEPMFTAMNMSRDEESLDEFLSFCNVWINDTCSMVAIEEGEKKAVGALIGRVYIKRDMNREFARMPEEESKSPTPEPEKPKKSVSRKSLRRQSKKSIRRQSKKSIRRQSKKSIRRQSKKSIRRQSKKKSIRRKSKKSIRRQSTKGGRRKSSKGGRRMSTKGKGKKTTSEESIKKKKPERVYKFRQPVDKIPLAPQTKKTTSVFDDEGILYKTEPLQKIQKLRNFVAKKYDVFESLSKNKYYKIYLMVVHRDYRRKGIGKTLMRSLFRLCSGFRIDVAAGIFTSYIAQNMAFKLGGKVAFEMNYDDWAVEGDIVFSNVPDPNYSISLMYLPIPPAEEGSYGDKVQIRPPVPRRADFSDRILV